MFGIYNTILLWAKKYRNFKPDPALTLPDFDKQIGISGYVQFGLDESPKSTAILFPANSKYISKSHEFKILLSKYKVGILYMFTVNPLPSTINKLLHKTEYASRVIYNFKHKHFTHEIPLGPYVPTHTILTDTESKKICSDLNIIPVNLPKISIDDPQSIWIGAKIGQIIELRDKSPIAGKAIRYRYVCDLSGIKISEDPMPEADGDGEELKLLDTGDEKKQKQSHSQSHAKLKIGKTKGGADADAADADTDIDIDATSTGGDSDAEKKRKYSIDIGDEGDDYGDHEQDDYEDDHNNPNDSNEEDPPEDDVISDGEF